MNPTVGTFISQSSQHASMNFAISYGTLIVAKPDKTLASLMPLLTFAWINSVGRNTHKPIIHSQN
jgi:hypothetical protein